MDFRFSRAIVQGRKRPRFNRDQISQFDDDANQANDLTQDTTRVAKLPIDWSLKSRVRFISSQPFPFCGQFKALEDAAGITSFVRCLSNPQESRNNNGTSPSPSNSSSNLLGNVVVNDLLVPRMMPTENMKSTKEETIESSQIAILRKYTFVWMYPNFPWLQLFPRIESSVSATTVRAFGQDSNSKQESLFKDSKSPFCDQLRHEWCSSLRSLYHLVKAKHCPFFYVCDNTFTILFRAAGVAGIDNVHALISNSTLGLRNMLKDEGIDFIMPFMSDADKTSEHVLDAELKETVDGSGLPLEEDSQLFLESLGLSQQDFPSMKSARTNFAQEDKKKTLLYIKGKDTNLLLNFLMNTNLIVSTTGRMAGIPPTLISSVAFAGASLHPLKLKVSQINHNGQQLYNLDLIGPVLPNIIQMMVNFFRNSLQTFKCKLDNYDNSSSFTNFHTCSVPKGENLISLFATENLKECGLSKELVGDICRQGNQSKMIINEIVVDSNGFCIK